MWFRFVFSFLILDTLMLFICAFSNNVKLIKYFFIIQNEESVPQKPFFFKHFSNWFNNSNGNAVRGNYLNERTKKKYKKSAN